MCRCAVASPQQDAERGIQLKIAGTELAGPDRPCDDNDFATRKPSITRKTGTAMREFWASQSVKSKRAWRVWPAIGPQEAKLYRMISSAEMAFNELIVRYSTERPWRCYRGCAGWTSYAFWAAMLGVRRFWDAANALMGALSQLNLLGKHG